MNSISIVQEAHKMECWSEVTASPHQIQKNCFNNSFTLQRNAHTSNVVFFKISGLVLGSVSLFCMHQNISDTFSGQLKTQRCFETKFSLENSPGVMSHLQWNQQFIICIICWSLLFLQRNVLAEVLLYLISLTGSPFRIKQMSVDVHWPTKG